MNDSEYVKQLLAPRRDERKKTIKQVHNEIFINKTKKAKT